MLTLSALSTHSELDKITGGLSNPSKMPGYAYGLPAKECKVGSKLVDIAGSVCSKCYALKGRYGFANVQTAQYRRFEAIRHPKWVDAMVASITKRGDEYFRWHDSGDLQDMEHLTKIVEIARRCHKVKFWMPTREKALIRDFEAAGGVMPINLVVRVSATMIDGPAPLNFKNTSTVTTGEPTCPAYTQGGVCGTCRACWNPKVKNVSYPKH